MTAATSPATTQLLEILSQLRGANRLGRAKVLAQAAQALRSLDPTERRDVATRMARAVAPQLLPHVDAMVDEKLTPAQQGTLLELVRKLDPDAVAEVAQQLLVDETAPEAEGEPMDIVADVSGGDVGHVEPITLVEELADQPPSLDEPWTIAPADVPDLGADGGEVVALPIAGTHAPAEDDTTDHDAPVAPATALGLAGAAGVAVLPRPTRDELVPALDEEPTDPPVDVLALVLAAPDGWQRRRTALRSVQRGQVTASTALDILSSLGRDSDRAWVAGAILDARILTFDDVESMVPPTSHARLRRRAEG